SGSRLVTWTYIKDSSVSAGEDAGWLDEVVYVPSPPTITTQPQSRTMPAGTNVTFTVAASSPGLALSFQWLKDGTNMPGAVQSSLNLPNLTRRNAGTYRVRVSSNSNGASTLSSNAVLKVIVKQRLSSIRAVGNGAMEWFSGDADGGLLSPQDLPAF